MICLSSRGTLTSFEIDFLNSRFASARALRPVTAAMAFHRGLPEAVWCDPEEGNQLRARYVTKGVPVWGGGTGVPVGGPRRRDVA